MKMIKKHFFDEKQQKIAKKVYVNIKQHFLFFIIFYNAMNTFKENIEMGNIYVFL